MSLLKNRPSNRLSRIIRRLLQQHKAKTARMAPEGRPRWWQAPALSPAPAR